MENSAILGKQRRGKNCSVPLQKLCVKSKGRASAHANCCGFVAINGVLVADIRLGVAPGEKFHLMQPDLQKHAHHLSSWPDLPSSFLPTLELRWCRVPPRAIPSSAHLGCLRGAAHTSGCAGRGQGVNVPGGTDPAWACSTIWEDHEKVFGWGQQLFVIPHSGFKNSLSASNEWLKLAELLWKSQISFVNSLHMLPLSRRGFQLPLKIGLYVSWTLAQRADLTTDVKKLPLSLQWYFFNVTEMVWFLSSLLKPLQVHMHRHKGTRRQLY